MAKVVSQETFDSVVLENVLEFDMDIEDAINDAIKEFESQGVHLGTIVKNMHLSEDKQNIIHDILVALEKIKCAADGSPSESDISAPLATFSAECKVSVAHRVLANKNNAYEVLIKLIKKVQGDPALLAPSVKAMGALMEQNSDILTLEGIELLLDLLKDWTTRNEESRVPEYLGRWSTECCLKHERNRQTMVTAGSLGILVAFLKGQKSNSKAIRTTSKAIRAFTLDDDMRQEYGKAHEHARLLVEEHGLIPLCLEMIKDWLQESDTASELLSTVSKLCVRAEYCQEAVDHDALIVINDILVSFPDHASLNKQSMTFLKTLVGNDKVKAEAMKTGSPQLIIAALAKHQAIPGVCEAACSAISFLALRVSDHAKQLMQLGAGQAIVQAMKVHSNQKQLQKLGCMAIRNLVSRVPENQQMFIEYNVEDVIHAALENHGESVKDVAQAALRDLDLKVNLVEQWRGTGHEISR
ncbi:armadillo repeat-containing protein 6-like [Penaeus chinensis]|uniref:armadillo repeat-containing protein 6-like n=1 Tax=Penaeus chinensis TaxID=139456 RepID=UPI001FB5AC8D|nr:armadillo repeat-containing protein 6-like [Penaeus chinensis]XP_047491038.1 armadillo repeat-containing protein 6-like [Penaeus chinensis]XP_047491039.1 armadillo repeat-containing protein 6-like [Penaeus chinensis]